MKNILKRNRQELILLLIILAVGGIIGGINPVFFSTFIIGSAPNGFVSSASAFT